MRQRLLVAPATVDPSPAFQSGNGIKLSRSEREALECGGSTPLSHSMIDHGMGKRRRAAALQRLPPILVSKLNAIGVLTPVEG